MIPLEHRAEVGSTQDLLKRRAAAGAGECALMADRQTGGTGRLGRPWESIPGNLSLSVLLRPGGAFQPGHWSLLAAVALAACVPQARLKWPNDLLLGDGKLAGILLDRSDDPPWLVLGFGVNLARAPALGRATACLAQLGAPPAPAVFARRLLGELDGWRQRLERDGFEPVRAAWLNRGPAPGAPVSVTGPAGTIRGGFGGLAASGAMLLEANGAVRTVTSGEVE